MGGLTKWRVSKHIVFKSAKIPEDFWELQSLGDFNASGCSTLSRLPNSFRRLPNLIILNLNACGAFQSLPICMGGLTKLRVLNISYSEL